MGESYLYEQTAANNNSAPPDGWPENQAYATVNNCAREMMAADAREIADRNATLVSTGTAPDYVVTSNRAIPNLTAPTADGLIIGFTAHAGNSGLPTTLDLNGLGATPVELPDGNAPTLFAGAAYQVVFDAALVRWQLLTVTVPEDEFPVIQPITGTRTILPPDMLGLIFQWQAPTGGGNIAKLDAACLGAPGRVRFLVTQNDFDLDNRSGAVIYRTDATTSIAPGGIERLTGAAYTLLAGPTYFVLTDFLA